MYSTREKLVHIVTLLMPILFMSICELQIYSVIFLDFWVLFLGCCSSWVAVLTAFLEGILKSSSVATLPTAVKAESVTEASFVNTG